MRFTDEGLFKTTIQVVPRTIKNIKVRPESFDFWGGLFQLGKTSLIKKEKELWISKTSTEK